MKSKKVLIAVGVITYAYIDNNRDSVIFKKEYEEYNNKTWEYGDLKGTYLELNIDKNNPIVYLNDDNIVKELTSGTKIIFFSSPDCNPCRANVSPLLKAAKEDGIEEVYYYNLKEVRTAYEQGKNNKQSKIYEQIVKTMPNYIETTFETGPNKGKKKLISPAVVLIKKGKVKNYYNASDNKSINYNKELTEKDYEQLYNVYEKMMTELILCTEEC